MPNHTIHLVGKPDCDQCLDNRWRRQCSNSPDGQHHAEYNARREMKYIIAGRVEDCDFRKTEPRRWIENLLAKIF